LHIAILHLADLMIRRKYYDRLSTGKLNAHDLINKGHLALCRGKKREAVDIYKQSIVSGELSKEQFITISRKIKSYFLLSG